MATVGVKRLICYDNDLNMLCYCCCFSAQLTLDCSIQENDNHTVTKRAVLLRLLPMLLDEDPVCLYRIFEVNSHRLTHLHWLSVHRRIQYKIALLTYKSLSTNQPPYLRNLLHIYQPLRCLRSASQNLLSIPFCTTNFGKRSFSFSSPAIWNELPAAIRESSTLDTFKRRLKTHLTSLTTRSV